MAEAKKTPWLARELAERGSELLPRFAECYTRLRGLPRGARRALQRKFKQSLAGVAVLLVLGGRPVQAADITVRGGCTIVDAIKAANEDTAMGSLYGGQQRGGHDRASRGRHLFLQRL